MEATGWMLETVFVKLQKNWNGPSSDIVFLNFFTDQEKLYTNELSHIHIRSTLFSSKYKKKNPLKNLYAYNPIWKVNCD